MEWQDEKKALLATIRRQEHETAALARRFKILQQTLKEQQKLVDRYQHALEMIQVKIPATAAASIASPIDTRKYQPLTKPKFTTQPKIESTEITLMKDYPWRIKRNKTVMSIAKAPVFMPEATRKTNENKTMAIEVKPVIVSTRRRHTRLASTWAEEKQKMKLKKPKWTKPTGALSVSGTFDKENIIQPEERVDCPMSTFAYVEVVRNREERKALPGYDCIECKKYYDALGEIAATDVAAQKHKCSRHRARFQPYETPDDFWRLSFPDSESQ
ncbi:unnamed protein product [Peronospora belbahrii]|uniref:DNA endonuclease activator Ctp1 C-terminal domain-containing protein n=1 Tax=Peronospora belbahrii TaxID=622444 RepID=A0ABN8D8X6_9STRA|nr:unnamed protein product [Peronospora belbahrii]